MTIHPLYNQNFADKVKIQILKYKMQQLYNHFFSQTRDHAKSLFEALLAPKELEPILVLDQNRLSLVLAKSGKYFQRNIDKRHKKILIFLANYHKILNTYALKHENVFTNNMVLHFISLLGYSRIKDNQIDEAKNIFKNVWSYVDISSCCKNLLSIAISNLSFLYIKNKKYLKALECSLKCIELMGQHLHSLRVNKKKDQLIEDSVILINGLIQCRKVLKKLKSENGKTFYAELYFYINEIGYKCSRKYLGKNSQFTKVFDQQQNDGRLPIFLEPIAQKTSLQERILKQLEGIHQSLKTGRQPEVIYINEPKIIQNKQISSDTPITIKQPEIIEIQSEPLQEQEEMAAGPSFSFQLNGWSLQMHFLRPTAIQQAVNKSAMPSKFIFGNLLGSYKKGNQKYEFIISAQRLSKLIALNLHESSIFSDLTLERLSDYQFFRNLLIPFTYINEQGGLQIKMRHQNLVSPYKQQFLKENCIIFIDHIQSSNIKLSISPSNFYNSLDIIIELSNYSANKLMQIQQKTRDQIHNAYERVKEFNYEGQIEIPQLKENKSELTVIKIRNQKTFKQIIRRFLDDFQHFILQSEQEDKSQFNFMQFLNNYEQQDQLSIFLFKQKQSAKSKTKHQQNQNKMIQKENPPVQNPNKNNQIQGAFYLGKYLENINAFEILCQNNFLTFDLDSQSKAKGTTMLYNEKFQREFGISLKILQKQKAIRPILEIILKIFQLKLFFQPLKTRDQQIFSLNSLVQLPILCKSHRRCVLKDQNGYMVPVTISNLTVNNTTPLAFKIEAYFPSEGGQFSVLLKINSSLWEKPMVKGGNSEKNKNLTEKEQDENIQKENLKVRISNYQFNIDYFLVEWCQIWGYDLLLKNITIRKMKIYLKDSALRYFSFQRLLQYLA